MSHLPPRQGRNTETQIPSPGRGRIRSPSPAQLRRRSNYDWKVIAAYAVLAAMGLYLGSDPVSSAVGWALKVTAVSIVVVIVAIVVIVSIAVVGQQTGTGMERANARMRAGGGAPTGSTEACAGDVIHDFSCDEKASVGRH